jgi:hypothetical protein
MYADYVSIFHILLDGRIFMNCLCIPANTIEINSSQKSVDDKEEELGNSLVL